MTTLIIGTARSDTFADGIRAADLQKLRVPWSRVQHFVVTLDHKPRSRSLESPSLARRLQPTGQRQLKLFSDA